jgi:hypothetical protein
MLNYSPLIASISLIEEANPGTIVTGQTQQAFDVWSSPNCDLEKKLVHIFL